MDMRAGMVDLHSHILWGLDDGAPDRETSVQMLEIAASHGTTDLVATPHANNQYRFDPKLAAERLEELQGLAPEGLTLHLGSDFHLSFGNIEAVLQDRRPFTIRGGRYLMVELPETHIPASMGAVFERMLDSGIFPVITHPERNRELARERSALGGWIELGCAAQVTAGSLEGRFGQTAKAASWRMLAEGFVHFVASDAHDAERRPPRLDGAYEEVRRKFSEETADLLFQKNPRRALESLSLEPQKLESPRKSRFPFWRL